DAVAGGASDGTKLIGWPSRRPVAAGGGVEATEEVEVFNRGTTVGEVSEGAAIARARTVPARAGAGATRGALVLTGDAADELAACAPAKITPAARTAPIQVASRARIAAIVRESATDHLRWRGRASHAWWRWSSANLRA